MRTLTTAFLAASLLVASLIACGGGETTNPPPATPETPKTDVDSGAVTTAPPPAAADAGAAVTPPPKEPEPVKFSALPHDKQVEIMSSKVVPNVGKDFKDFDGKRFDKFGCATCHGKKHDDPHKVLPKLTMSNGGFEKMQKKHPEMVKFMGEKVVPDMAAALGEKPFDPATKQGFGCAGCHEVK